MVLSLVFFFMFFHQVVPIDNTENAAEHPTTNLFLGWAFALFAIAALLSIAFPAINFVKGVIDEPKSVIIPLCVLVGVAAIIGVIFALSNGAVDSIYPTMVESSEAERWWSDAGLKLLWTSLVLTGIAVIFAFTFKFFRK